jgi:hypothetical protein
MRNPWVVVLLLVSSLSVAAQETKSTRLNLLDDPAAKDVPGAEAQDKKQDETRVITAEKLQEEQPVGPYKRPEWTMHRRSPTTRIYLQVDPGEVEFEQWVDIRIPRGGGQPKVRLSEEFEFGLGGRFQLDLYVNSILIASGPTTTLTLRSWAGEIRYALADWGVIPGNPTLYLEYLLWNNGVFTDGTNPSSGGDGDAASSSIEVKLLLGDEIGTRWHWGFNIFYEHTLGPSVLETGVTLSLIYAVVDKLFSVGITASAIYESDGGVLQVGGQNVRSREVYLGPSFQFRLAPYEAETEVNGVKTKVQKTRAHLDFEPIFGITREAKWAKVLIVFGWDF